MHVWHDYFDQLAFQNFGLACTLWAPEPVYSPFSVVLIQLIIFKVTGLFIYYIFFVFDKYFKSRVIELTKCTFR